MINRQALRRTCTNHQTQVPNISSKCHLKTQKNLGCHVHGLGGALRVPNLIRHPRLSKAPQEDLAKVGGLAELFLVKPRRPVERKVCTVSGRDRLDVCPSRRGPARQRLDQPQRLPDDGLIQRHPVPYVCLADVAVHEPALGVQVVEREQELLGAATEVVVAPARAGVDRRPVPPHGLLHQAGVALVVGDYF